MTVKLWNFICVVTKRPFRELPQNLGKACVPWLMALSVTGQTAEECENDTYLKAWQSIPPHEPKKVSVCLFGSHYAASVAKLLPGTQPPETLCVYLRVE